MPYTYPGRDIDMETIDWNSIAKHEKSTYRGFADSHLESCAASESSHKTIGRICREFGYNNNAIYANDRTTANIYKARQTMLNLLLGKCAVTQVKAYENYTVDEIFSLLHKNNSVALISGVDYSVGDFGSAHAWVLCGGEQIITTQNNPTIGHENEIITTIKSYLYFNWGHFGSYNGYFPIGIFDQKGSVVPSRNNYDSEVSLFFVNNL